MSQKLEPRKYLSFNEGIVQGVNYWLTPEKSIRMAVNLVFDDEIGAASVREGTEKLGNEVGSACEGLYQFIKTDGSKKLLGAFGNNLYSLENGTWTQRETVSGEVNFLTFADTVLTIDDSEVYTSDDGVNFSTSGGNLNIDDMPDCKFGINWKDRVYVAGDEDKRDRIYFSTIYGVPNDGEVGWEIDDGAGYIDVDPEDGAGGITGLAKVPGYLLIFKERSLHRWDGRALHPETLIRIGAKSHKSIALGRETLFFWNEKGVYETNGGYPQKVSRRIKSIVDAVDPTYEVSAWGDSEEIYFSIGDIELDGLNLQNCIIAYNLIDRTWTLHSFNREMKFLTQYVDDREYLIAGDNNGQVWKLFEGHDDDGQDIDYHMQMQRVDLQNLARKKNISKLFVYTDKIRNGQINCSTDGGNFEALGNVNKDISIVNCSLRGNYFDFRIKGSGTYGEKIKGVEIADLSLNIGT